MRTTTRLIVGVAGATALLASLLVTVATPAAATGCDTLTNVCISIATSPSGDVPVGQARTVNVGLSGLGVGSPYPDQPINFHVSVPSAFRIDSVPSRCHRSTDAAGNSVNCDFTTNTAPTQVAIGVTATSESYDARFDASVWLPEVFEATDSLTLDAYVPGVTADVHPLAFDAPNPLVVGQQFTLAGFAANAGTTTMNGVTATVDLGAPLQLGSATWGTAHTPCTVSGSRATCDIGSLPGRSSVPVSVTGTPTATASSATATVRVTSTTPEQSPDPLPDTVAVTRPVQSQFVDLGVAIALPAGPLRVDAPAAGTVTVTNHGTIAAPGVVVTATFSAGYAVTPRSDGSATGYSCSASGQTLTCTLTSFGSPRSLAAGGSTAVAVVVDARTTTAGSLGTAVSTSATEPTPDPTPDTASATIPAAGPASADLRITGGWTENLNGAQPTVSGFDTRRDIVAGTRTWMVVLLTQSGPSTARDVRATFHFPPGWDVSGSVTSDGRCTAAGTTVTCTEGDWVADGGTLSVGANAVPTTAGAGQVVDVTVTSTTPVPGAPLHAAFVYDVVDRPTLAVGAPGSVTEGGAVQVPVALSVLSPLTVTVTCVTGGWTATAGADYTETHQTISFPPGTTSASLAVPTRQDALDEANTELVLVACGGITNARPAAPDPTLGLQWTAFGITDDDPLPTLTPGVVRQSEGAAATVSVPITLSAPSGRPVTVRWSTEDDAATAPGDYTAASGTLTFAPGETAKSVAVTIRNDAVREPDELFLVRLSSPVNAKIGGFFGVALVTIVNDD